MAETKKKNKKKKVTISEEDISLLLRRYSAATIIALLQEVAQFPDAKIDWKTLVQKTSTGITNAREYQMVWRHLAYRDTLLENVDGGAQPLDDDSDLESDLEAFPPVSGEASVEAAACAKVLLGSGLPSDSGSLNRSTVEAPLTINIPNGQASPAASDNPQSSCKQGKNITVPVSVQRLPLPTATPTDGLEGIGSAGGGLPARRKRKPWTEEEDLELIAAVQKCGERNWANILKGDFKGDRTASQLSQRWAIIRKRQANLNIGGSGNPANSQLTEAQLATRRAVSHALNMPMVNNMLTTCSVGATQSSIPSSSAAILSSIPSSSAAVQSSIPSSSAAVPSSIPSSSAAAVPLSIPSSSAAVPSGPEDTSPRSQTQQAANSKGASNTTTKSRITTVTAKKGSSFTLKSLSGPNPMIQATAVAAGARIATPSAAASLLRAAQSKNVVHIRPGGNSMIKTSLPGATKSSPTNHLGSRPNVHYIRTGSVPTSAPPTYSGPSPSIPLPGSIHQEHSNSTRPQMATCSLPLIPASTTLRPPQMTSASFSSAVLCANEEGKMTNAISTVDVRLMPKEGKKSEERKDDDSRNVSEQLSHQQPDLSSLEVLHQNQTSEMENLKQLPHNVDAGENKQSVVLGEKPESSNAINTETCATAMDED